ncbi:MAG: PQQ-binding-like beta-propeller repeat protein [Thermaerobacter sp.]|nr:PQQ-binding-like beta-propeller repeat protein [Thermaerobacter sp.]
MRRAVPAILLVLLLAGQAGAQNPASSGWAALGQNDQRQGQAGWSGTPDQKASYPPGSPVLWSYQMGGLYGPTAGEAVGPHGTTYVASQNGTLYAVGVQGQEKWSFNLGAPADTAPVLGDNGWVYAGAGDTFYAVAAAGGTQAWSFDLSGKGKGKGKGKGWSAVGSPALAGGTVYFTANHGRGKGYVFALDAATGAEEWQYRLADATRSAPALSPDGATLYVGDQGGNLYALDAAKGTPVSGWPVQPTVTVCPILCFQVPATALATPAVGPGGNVYVGGQFGPFGGLGGVVSVYPSGQQRWSYDAGPFAALPAAPALTSSGSLYIGQSTLTGGALLSLSRSDGDPNWSYATPNPVASAPAVGEHGAAYFGDAGDAFYAVSASGSLLWRYQLDSAVRDAAAVGPDGTVYVATSAATGSLYALQQVHFAFALPQPFPACSQVSITVYADNPAGGAVLGYAGPAALTGSPQSVTPSVTGGFTGGAWTGPVQIATATTGETLTATDPGNPAYTGTSAPFTVVAGPLASVSISPTSASLGEGQSQAFAAQAYDGCGNAITSGVSYAWSATGGTVSPATGSSTTYTAPDVPGTYTVTVTASQGTQTAQAQATVTVSSSLLAVSPPSAVLAVPLSQGAAAAPAAQQFTATYVGNGGQVRNVGPTAQWTASSGTLSCTQCAAPVFTPPGPGSYTVTCTYRGLTGQATVQAVQAVRMVDASAAAGPSSLVAQLEQDGALVRVLTWLLH